MRVPGIAEHLGAVVRYWLGHPPASGKRRGWPMALLTDWFGVRQVVEAWRARAAGEFGPRRTPLRTDGTRIWMWCWDFPVVIRVCEDCNTSWGLDLQFAPDIARTRRRAVFVLSALEAMVGLYARLPPDELIRASQSIQANPGCNTCVDGHEPEAEEAVVTVH